ncbi:MAG: hypothetical protein K0R12_1398, partial [Gammaproteobacteria bacterium]|nr:hypothetical protein [Gammaproteobacteria bacterium]
MVGKNKTARYDTDSIERIVKETIVQENPGVNIDDVHLEIYGSVTQTQQDAFFADPGHYKDPDGTIHFEEWLRDNNSTFSAYIGTDVVLYDVPYCNNDLTNQALYQSGHWQSTADDFIKLDAADVCFMGTNFDSLFAPNGQRGLLLQSANLENAKFFGCDMSLLIIQSNCQGMMAGGGSFTSIPLQISSSDLAGSKFRLDTRSRPVNFFNCTADDVEFHIKPGTTTPSITLDGVRARNLDIRGVKAVRAVNATLVDPVTDPEGPFIVDLNTRQLQVVGEVRDSQFLMSNYDDVRNGVVGVESNDSCFDSQSVSDFFYNNTKGEGTPPTWVEPSCNAKRQDNYATFEILCPE